MIFIYNIIMNQNILRYKYMKICKTYNLDTNRTMTFIQLKNILDIYFIKINAIKKIVNAYKIYKLKRSDDNIKKLISENKILKNEIDI